MERKLYVEYRLYFDPIMNQELLRELATQFQEHIHDEWNDNPEEKCQVQDVTYEIVMEITDKLMVKE